MLHSYMLAYEDLHTQLVRLVRRGGFDCVVLSHIISPIVPLLSRGRPLVFDYKDVYSRSASAPFRFPLKALVYWTARLFEELLFACSTEVIAPSPSIQTLLRSRYGIDSILITNGVDTTLFHPTSGDSRANARARLGFSENDFVVCYVGSIENWLDLETVVSALESFSPARLVLVGGPVRSGEYLQSILSLCDRERLGNRVTALGFKKPEEAAEILSCCDAAIIPFRVDTELSRVALPDKLFEYLASGIPVISTRLPDVAELFGSFVSFYQDQSSLVHVMESLSRREHAPDLKLDRPALVERYDWRMISRKYQDVLRDLIRTHAERAGVTKPY